MINHLVEAAQDMVPGLYNKIWDEGRLPISRKPGRDGRDPGKYRPIALTSNTM